MKEVNVQTQIIIKRPLAEVSDYAADPDNAPGWYKNIRQVKWLTGRPLGVGSKMAFNARFLGRDLSYIYEVQQWEPGQLMVMATADGPFPMETTYQWEELEDGSTRMTLINRGSPAGFAAVFSPFMARAMRKASEKDLRLLKQILESRE